MEYEDTFEKDTFRFLFVENQRRQSMWFKGKLKMQLSIYRGLRDISISFFKNCFGYQTQVL